MVHVINANSVSDALAQGLHYLRVKGEPEESRVGDIIVAPVPVVTVTRRPLNRVLFSPMRDANPFFHVMEALWMLAGRNDLPWLTRFNQRFTAYSDDGGLTQPGAYGYRWRQYFGYDQINVVIDELKRNPKTRRCVLQMWDGGVLQSGQGVGGDLMAAMNGSADVPCNTCIYFDTLHDRLNMTVSCRSNDALWGAHGANAVHFSFLLEYMAAMTGMKIGVMRQFSNNYHVYTNVLPRDSFMPMARDVERSDRHSDIWFVPKRVMLVTEQCDVAEFQRKLDHFMDAASDVDQLRNTVFAGDFFGEVAAPMAHAWFYHKEKRYDEALLAVGRVRDDCWRIACLEWLQRRKIKHELNQNRLTDVVKPVSKGEVK